MMQQYDDFNENFLRRKSVDIDFYPQATTINKCLQVTTKSIQPANF